MNTRVSIIADLPGVDSVGAVMALGTLAACYLPVRRAARLDPTLALRSD